MTAMPRLEIGNSSVTPCRRPMTSPGVAESCWPPAGRTSRVGHARFTRAGPNQGESRRAPRKIAATRA